MLTLLRAYKKYDPASRSLIEILLLYPGVKATAIHRLAHLLFRFHVPFVPRALAELGRFLTGIEIHPGAHLGCPVIFNHGMGVVIGETSVIGDEVIIYQGVTLGGTSLERHKRHPTIGNKVVLGAGAKILGGISIGDDSRVGANSVVIENVPAGSTVVGIPGRVIARRVVPGKELDHELID